MCKNASFENRSSLYFKLVTNMCLDLKFQVNIIFYGKEITNKHILLGFVWGKKHTQKAPKILKKENVENWALLCFKLVQSEGGA